MASIAGTRYHVGINGNGFMLRGAPKAPQYVKERAPALVNQLGTGDLDYNKLNGSGWSYWTQTDWAGGFQRIKFEDKANFRDGQAVNVISKFGEARLQNGFISAASISGNRAFTVSSVHEDELMIGTVKSNTPQLLSLTSAGTLATKKTYAGLSAITALERFNDNTIIGLTRVSGSVNTWEKYTGSAVSGFRSTNDAVRALRAVGIRLYAGEYNNALSGDQLLYTTDLSTFTSAYNTGKNRKITNIEQVAGKPYFFVQEGNKVELFQWDEFAERAYPIHEWTDLSNFGVTRFLSFIIISGETAGRRIAFAFNGARIWQIFDDQLVDTSYDFSKPFEFDGNLHTKGSQWDGKFWFPGLYGDYQGIQYTPFANFGNRAYGYAVSGTAIVLAHTSAGHYATSGHVVSSQFGHNIGGVDKLVNSVDINMNALASGHTIEVLRSTDGGDNFTSVGNARFSVDGAVTKKRMYFPSGFVTKNWTYKTVLVSTSASTTPVLHDITHEYRPIPDLKKRWHLSLDAGDNIKLLNKQDEERDGRDLMSELWLEKESKRTVVFEDLRSWRTTVISAFGSDDTSARVASTDLMSPQGRMRIISAGVVEEMTYTSADGNRILGITRSLKGTPARSYGAGVSADNFYNVVVTNIKEEANTTDEQKTESIARITLLEV